MTQWTPPPGAHIWAHDTQEPEPDRSFGGLDFDDGCYFSLWPHGAMRLFAKVVAGQLVAWVRAEESGDSGYFRSDQGRCAQRYFRDGRLEDFSPWDDTSKPYPAPMPFAAWLQSMIDDLSKVHAFPPQDPAYEEYLRDDRSDDPIPGADRPFSGHEQPPENLEKLLAELGGVRWAHPYQCYERLVNWAKLPPEEARNFTNLVPHACAWAVMDPKRRQSDDLYLYPLWHQPGQFGSGSLMEIPLYKHIREQALQLTESERKSFEHWVRSLAEVHPSMRGMEYESKLPHPILWTVPPPGTDSFWMTMVTVSLQLRQEAGKGGDLSNYVQTVDAERFYHLAGLAGAFLQASANTSCWYFDPSAQPWDQHQPYNDDLADLIAHLDDQPLLASGRDSTARWRLAPLLAALGQWVHSRSGSGPADAVVYNLGRFINDSAETLGQRLRAFQDGRLSWDAEGSMSWPDPGMHDMGGWHGAWNRTRRRLREQGQLFAGQPQTAEIFADFKLNAFLHRLEVAGLHLVAGPPEHTDLWQRQLVELEAYLASHSTLGESTKNLLQRDIVGVPVHPGPTYQRLLASAHWVLQPWAAPGDSPPGRNLYPALRLVQWILPAL